MIQTIFKTNNIKGHGAPIIPMWLIYSFFAILYFALFGIGFALTAMIRLKYPALPPIRTTIIITIIIIALLYSYYEIKNWYWQHYGFYYSYLKSCKTWYGENAEIRPNGEIYVNKRPYILKGKYYGWRMVIGE